MDREKALEIFELSPNATEEDIKKRATVIYKKLRIVEKDKRGYTIDDVEEAYNCLMNITFVDEEAEKEKAKRKQHPNPILKALKIDEERARNFLHYHKWHIVAIFILTLIIAAAIVFFVTYTEPDLYITVGGDVLIQDVEEFIELINNRVEEVKNVQVINTYLESDSENPLDYITESKLMLEVMVGNNDLYILDEERYFYLAKQGALKPVDTFVSDYELRQMDVNLQSLEGLVVNIEVGNNASDKADLYGIDVTDSEFFKSSGIASERIILCFGLDGEFPDNAKAFIYEVLKYGMD